MGRHTTYQEGDLKYVLSLVSINLIYSFKGRGSRGESEKAFLVALAIKNKFLFEKLLSTSEFHICLLVRNL